MAKSFNSKPSTRKADIEFDLDGRKFYFKPVKQSTSLISMVQVRGDDMDADMERVGALLDWLIAGLDREYYKAYQKDPNTELPETSQWKVILDRLKDPDDELEFDTVVEITNWLMSESSGNPTT